MANDKITGEGLIQLAQVANVARSFLAGPEDFATRVIVRKVAELAGIEKLTTPITSVASPLATIGKVAGISALAPLGPIGMAAGLIGSIFGKKKSQGPIIAHLPPHTIIQMIHNKEAIHLFLKSAGLMEAELQKMESYAGQRGALPGNMPRCTPPSVGASPLSAQLAKTWFSPLNLPRMSLPGYRWDTSYRGAPWLWVVGQAWGPGSDAEMRKMVTSIVGATIKGISRPTITNFGNFLQARFDARTASACVKQAYSQAHASGGPGSLMKTVGGGDAVMSLFSVPKVLSAIMKRCPNERLVHFGSPYICAWQQSWQQYQPNILRAYRAEIGNWMHQVAAHPLYKDLIQQMVDIELERKKRRASNARGVIELIKNPTAKNIREYAFQPIGPALIQGVTPTTPEALGIKQVLLTSRTEAKDAVNRVQAAVNKITKDERLKGMLESLLEQAKVAATKSFDTTNANEASKAAGEAKALANKAEALTTPGIARAFTFFQDPKVFIPALIAAGLFLAATSEEGA